MSDRVPIFAGLFVFVGLFTAPLWHAVAHRGRPAVPDVKLPVAQKACVAPVDYMRRAHMKLLTDWREGVVRRGERSYAAYDGKLYDEKLTPTCLGQCHASKSEFCDRCHKYAAVSGPYCFDCHTEPKPIAGALTRGLQPRGDPGSPGRSVLARRSRP
ncbi:MAG: sulfate reduction electron transfer complex DsrMKJOP subunit DsrJ [Terriglobales bacterium]